MTYVTKDSGERVKFEGGSQRDSQEGKRRYDLIPPTALGRVADLYQRGADKYDEYNWVKGQPFSRLYASALRHMQQFRLGEVDEDHLAAVVWNCLAIMHFQETGRTELDDLLAWFPPISDIDNLKQDKPSVNSKTQRGKGKVR